ncbi:hypothetical protein Godav_025851, partial [Gossypium davidsonii]|nr:hypothetical protein [Gossypium davidsonii]
VNGKANFKEIDEKLKQLNKPAVKTIQSEDGDIIDCVDIYKQPAFDHHALKNHIIQMKPSFDLKEERLSSKNESTKLAIFQTWQRSGSCPEGTVPIRRIRREDLLRAKSVQQFGRKPHEVVLKSNTTIEHKDGQLPSINTTALAMPVIVNRSAATLVTVGYNYIGAKADINVWTPNVEAQDEYTTAQIWLKAGPGDNFESIESGWTVNPQLYGDKRTRLFAHWTKDSYKTTGCFDVTCSGFVQTSSQYLLGGSIEPVSTEFGQQYDLTVGIYMDPNTANWWLKIGKDIPVGYWPASTLLFYLNHSSTLVEWGGQVYSSNVKKKPHTKTGMGSGQFASGLRGNACYMDNIAIVDFSMQLKYPQWVGTWADEQVNGNANFKDVEEKLKQLNKPAVKTIQSEDGDIIDCVDIYKQPAFDHPALKNHVIQMKPSFDLKDEKLSSKNEPAELTVFQTWQRSGSCPEGTVPIRRIRREDLLRAKSVQQFGRKPHEAVLNSSTTVEHRDGQLPSINTTAVALPIIVNRSAATLVTLGYNYIGAKGIFNIWNPNVEAQDEYTTAQIWLKAGPGDNFESIESGW